jgi:hypothetical protein
LPWILIILGLQIGLAGSLDLNGILALITVHEYLLIAWDSPPSSSGNLSLHKVQNSYSWQELKSRYRADFLIKALQHSLSHLTDCLQW